MLQHVSRGGCCILQLHRVLLPVKNSEIMVLQRVMSGVIFRSSAVVTMCPHCRGIAMSKSRLLPRRGTRSTFREMMRQQEAQAAQRQDKVRSADPPPLTHTDFSNVPIEKLLKESTLSNTEERKKLSQDELNKKRDQTRHRWETGLNAEDTSVLLFPGQGAQFVGMSKKMLKYPKVMEMFSVASEILGYDLLELCLEGPIEKLSRTEYLQPAMLLTSLAAVEKLKATDPSVITSCVATAGFSVGEYAALVFSGALSFEDAVSVVHERGRAMQAASEVTESGMMTVFLHPSARLKMACHTAVQYCNKRLDIPNAVCTTANFLYPECKVIAGNKEALDFIQMNHKDFGIKRVKWLPVSGAFHTPLMSPAQNTLQRALENVTIKQPIIPVHSNVTARRYRSPGSVKSLLVDQICSPVKWEQTMHVLYSRKQGVGFPCTYEVGPGRQLGSLLRMVNRPAHAQYSGVDV